MNMAKDSVKIFPITNSRGVGTNALNEKNISGILECATDNEKYVIDYTPSEDHSIKFVINGYLFECKVADVIDELTILNDNTRPNDIYAGITVDKGLLQGGDAGDVTTYIEFESDLGLGKMNAISILHILTIKFDGTYEVPVDSRMRHKVDLILCGDASIFEQVD